MASISGWVAFSLLVFSFYLAVRIPLLNSIFNGLKRQLRWHHWIALLSFAAILYHIIQLFWNYAGYLSLLFDLGNIAIITGWISFAGIIIAIPLAFFRVQIPYRRWRIIHLATSVSLIMALFHIFLISEPQSWKEWTIFSLISIIAMLSLLLTITLPASRFWGMKYVITDLIEPYPNLFFLRLHIKEKKAAQHFDFSPGHFIYLKFISHGFSNIWHPFTIISRPSEPFIELFIKARGVDTNRLRILSLPAPVRILAPFGNAFWKHDKTQLWIAYGVGAAIFLAAIRSFPNNYHNKIHFICCDSLSEKIFFKDEFNHYMKAFSQFTWEIYIGTGQDFVEQFRHKPFDNKDFEYIRICGHPGFQNSLKSILISHGIQKRNIHLEGLL